jgi:hypothetical protein
MKPSIPAPLWSRRDRTRLLVAASGGAVLIGLSWFLAAGRDDAGGQLAPVSLSLVGAGVGFAASMIWLAHGRRVVRELSWLLLGSAGGATAEGPAAVALVAGPSARYFHRADCLLVAGRAFPALPRADHDRAGRQPCPACRP